MNNPFENIEQRLDRLEYLLLDMKGQGNPHDPANDLMTISQAADLISLTIPSIYGLVHKRAIPFSKKGKRLYFSKAELLEWIREGRRKTMAEARRDPEQHLKPLKQRKGATV